MRASKSPEWKAKMSERMMGNQYRKGKTLDSIKENEEWEKSHIVSNLAHQKNVEASNKLLELLIKHSSGEDQLTTTQEF